MTKIRFIRSGCNTSFGSFSPDDVATVGDALAAHFIALGCAELIEPPPPVVVEEAPITKPAEAPKRRRANPSE